MMMWWWILIPIVLVLAFFMFNARNRRGSTNKENPMDILDSRFAKGEISKEEYEEQKKMLNIKN